VRVQGNEGNDVAERGWKSTQTERTEKVQVPRECAVTLGRDDSRFDYSIYHSVVQRSESQRLRLGRRVGQEICISEEGRGTAATWAYWPQRGKRGIQASSGARRTEKVLHGSSKLLFAQEGDECATRGGGDAAKGNAAKQRSRDKAERERERVCVCVCVSVCVCE